MIAPEILDLTRGLRGRGRHITIETAGTVFSPVECDLMSISPKLAHSTPEGEWAGRHERLRIQPGVLRRLMDDMAEVRELVRALDADAAKVILMAEGIDAGALRDRGVWLAEIAKREGFRFSPRLHVELYGNRRGT